MADLKKTLDQALNQPMDRRQFLAQAGAIALGVVGVTAALKALERQSGGSSRGGSRGGGYGSSSYGG